MWRIRKSRRTLRTPAEGQGAGECCHVLCPLTLHCFALLCMATPRASTLLLTIGAAARAVRLMQWRSPPLLDVPEALKVDPSKCAPALAILCRPHCCCRGSQGTGGTNETFACGNARRPKRRKQLRTRAPHKDGDVAISPCAFAQLLQDHLRRCRQKVSSGPGPS